MAFLIDSIKKKLKTEDTEGELTDLHYQVGNTSGLDVGQVPSPLDQRIGRMAQIGGGIMEIQISNPATFQIDRPELMNVINQLGFDDITLHGDPNIGFTGAYATRGQGVQGYNIVHRYFKRYLEQMASFRWEMTEQRGDEDGLFDVGYVNMHASNESIPPREERLASDISVDPFGERLRDISDDGKDYNIYRNREFMKKLFDYFFIPNVDQPGQIYEGIFSDFSDEFRDEWNDAKEEIVDGYFENRTQDTEERIDVVQTANQIQGGVSRTFREEAENYGIGPYNMAGDEEDADNIDNLAQLIQTVASIQQQTPRDLLRPLGDVLYQLREGQVQGIDLQEIIDYDYEEVREAVDEVITERLWGINGGDSIISVNAKTRSIVSKIDEITESQIYQKAAERPELKEAAKELAFASEDWENIRKPIMENLVQRLFRDEIIQEANIFFQIMPAWMQTAEVDGEVPQFIWENVLRQSFEESDEVEGDQPYFEEHEDFEAFLDERRENELDVIAAVGACYIWGHFTQSEDKFEEEAFEQTVIESENYEEPDLENPYTWIEWMNKFGLKINIEAMFGSPGELNRVWRPKDIAIVCHAINRQARYDLGEDYRDNLVKFTIDMEHTASYGVDPWQEMEKLIRNEKELARDYPELDIDPDKPLAKIVKTYHLTKPGWEQQQGHRHGPFTRGDETLYYWLYHMVKNGFARNEKDEARIIFEVGGEYREEMYVTRVAMDMIKRGIAPDELDEILAEIPTDGEFETVEQELVARFFGMDKGSYHREWAKIEEHAFDPLDGLLQARSFDDTFSSQGAIEQGQARGGQWKSEEYR